MLADEATYCACKLKSMVCEYQLGVCAANAFSIVAAAYNSTRPCMSMTFHICLMCAMQAMADLFALQRIHQDIMFRNDDYVAPEKAKAIKRMIEKLCLELRGVCCPLVDAFAIPDFILRAPIGLSTAAQDPYSAYLQSIGWE